MLNISNKPQINLLLSTYNGEKYLKQQLQSLYEQTYAPIRIIVRDDGSTDSTLEILNKETAEKKINILESSFNKGPAASFFDLLIYSDDASYYGFCDQDDIWISGKIEMAINAINNFPDNIPVMYFSRLKYVDSSNKFIKLSPIPKKIGFGNALVENIATGCTIVMNKAARDLLIKLMPDKCLMHDSWCYLVISCFGKIIFDSRPSMRYRQHSTNVIGASTSPFETLVRRIKRFKFHKNKTFRFSDQAKLFLELYSNSIPSSERAMVSSLVDAKKSFIKRLMLAVNTKIWRQNIFDDFILRVLIIFNRF